MAKQIDKVERYNWEPKPAENARLQWIKVGELMVDHSYQRQKLEEKQVLAIARDFNWAYFGALIVKRRNGKLYVTDGQHRLAAAVRRGDISAVPCCVTESNGIEDEALSFVNTNKNRKAVSSYDKYRAMVVAGDKLHLEIESMLKIREMHVANSTCANVITFPTYLVKCFNNDPATATAMLDIQRIMIGDDERMLESVCKGIFSLIRNNPINESRLKDAADSVFRNGGRSALLQSIRKVCIESGTCAGEKACAAGVAAVANRRRRGSSRIII